MSATYCLNSLVEPFLHPDWVASWHHATGGGDGGGGGGGDGGVERIAVEVEGPHRYVGGTHAPAARLHAAQAAAAARGGVEAAAGAVLWEWDALKVKPAHKGEEVTSWQPAQREYLSERLEQIVPGWAA